MNIIGTRYRYLGQDVRDLQSKLGQLRQALETLSNESDGQDLDVCDLGQESQDLIGDFNMTLGQCQDMVSKRARPKRRAGFIKNVMWDVMVQDSAVNELRKHIQFHTQKILLILGCLKPGLMSTIRQDSAELLELVRNNSMSSQALFIEKSLHG